MGLFDDIKNNITNGAVSSITNAWNDLIDINSLSLPNVNLSDIFRTASTITAAFNGSGTNDITPQGDIISGIDKIWKRQNVVLEHTGADTFVTEFLGNIDTNNEKGNNEDLFTIESTDYADRLNFQSPDWSYADFINERAIFQKSLQNPLGERGWFYFKIFFNFDTQYGLLGGLLNNKNPLMATSSAYKYLHQCEALGKYYKANDRQVALMKFAKILSYISTYAPWFFKGIKNVNQANIPIIDDLTKERSIEIECLEDAIDMRLNTLLDLYKFACYDEIDQKEMVPDNLRKFDMTVMLFQAPIRYFHTSFRTNEGHKYNYKGTSVNSNTGFSDTMSFKMFTFINCEIDRECLGNMVPGNMNNEKPFNMGGGSIKIIYDRVYTHTMNEFMHIMFGNDGLYYDGSGSSANLHEGVNKENYEKQGALQRQRIKDIKKIHDTYTSPDPNDPLRYKSIIDASEALCTSNMLALGFNALGNYQTQSGHDPEIEHKRNEVSLTDYYKLKQDLLGNRLSTDRDGYITNVSSGSSALMRDLIETYNRTQAIINASWHESDKTILTDGRGFLKNSTPAQRRANVYWITKLAQMKDGIASPETLIERLGTQRYYYNNFTKSGYADKLVGTEYWIRKIKELNDGRIDFSNSVYNT